MRDDIQDLMQVMDVFLFPSLYEGLGIVLIEAQASGLKCVISDTIPNDGVVTENVTKLSLNQPAKDWANKVNSYRYYSRNNTSENIKQNKFDIESNVKWLQDYYLKNIGMYGGQRCQD